MQVILSVLGAVASALFSSIAVVNSGGNIRSVFVGLNLVSLFIGPGLVAGAGDQTTGSRICIGLATILLDIAVINLVWTGGYDNDTVGSRLVASLLVFTVASLVVTMVSTARCRNRRRPAI